MNRITLIGHTGHSAVSRATENGGMVTFSLAVSERRRNEQGEWENSRTDWFDCVLYTATKEGASTLGASIKSGTRLAVTGKMQSREYEKDGNKITPLEALNKFSCMRLQARVHDIEQRTGIRVKRQRVKVRNKFGAEVTVMQYSL